jgi:hypothetical protein
MEEGAPEDAFHKNVACEITCLTPHPPEAYSYCSNFEGWIRGARGVVRSIYRAHFLF